ncbi:MAG: ATP-binding protein [Desulfuromonadaceae bacterium]|nr:ATP-binding protein [Desulfuromonadaceae bacterium]
MNSELAISDVVGKFAETELRKFQRAAEIGFGQLLITDSDGIIEYVNPAFSRVTGYSYGEAVGKNVAILKSGRMPAAFYERMWGIIGTGADWSGEFFNRTKDGTLYIDKAVISAIKGRDGEISHFIKVSEDITLQRQMEEHQHRRLLLTESIIAANRKFMENGSLSEMAGIILETCMSVTSSSFALLYDILPNGNADILAISMTSLDPISEVTGFRDIQNELIQHGHYEIPLNSSLFMAPVIEKRTVVVNGTDDNVWRECLDRISTPLLHSFAGFPLKIGSGMIGMIGMANSERGYSGYDIEDFEIFANSCALAISAARAEMVRKSTKDKLMYSQKMEAIGQLAGGIAHDFNNLLTVINGYCTLAIQKAGSNDLIKRDIEQVVSAGERATSLIRQLLAFGRRQVLDPQPLKINTLISGLHKILCRLIGENISLITHLATDIGLIKSDPSQIEQVIMNLVINARDAMTRGGTITIETANCLIDSKFVSRNQGASEGEYVMISVRDTGIGMSEEVLARIFEPFFTTKEEYGTGLGLATVYGIINQSNGYIKVLSEVGIGSEFRLYIPRISQTPEVSKAGSSHETSIGCQGAENLILVVEDEPSVLNLASVTLSSLGYRVLTASGPLEALRIFDQYVDDIDILLTDVMMPEMSGTEMAMMMREKRAGLKVLFMSGYTEENINEANYPAEEFGFLMKPFSAVELSNLVHNCLTGAKKFQQGPYL